MVIWSAEIKDIEKLHLSFEGQLPELEREIKHLIENDDPNVILLYSRRCLEVIVTDLCECQLNRSRKTEPLKGIIDKLNREEKVPSNIIVAMDSLNSLSTFGTHPKEYDPEQVRPVLINLFTICKWYLKFKNAGSYLHYQISAETVEFPAIKEVQKSKDSEVLIDYTGPVNPETVESILTKYKLSKGYEKLDKVTGKRVYAIIVECLDNISRHSFRENKGKVVSDPWLSVKREQDDIYINTWNAVSENNKKEIASRINQINNLTEADLKSLYEKKIKTDLIPDKTGAGLGFIITALKSGNKIKYSFTESDNGNSFADIQIKVSPYFMNKLIINRTENSPQVYLDPEKNIYEISGESRPLDVPGFYMPVLKWLEEFSLQIENIKNRTEPIEFNFKLDYFNSLSAKYIFDFCKQLANLKANGKKITVKWHYEEDDPDMLEAGREMSRISRIPFEFVNE